MGLDMYLTKKKYVGAMYDFRNVTGTIDIKIGDKKLPINFSKVSYIEEQIAYWRKANAIHKWFVDNVQEGNDDCREYYVTLDQLKSLRNLCYEVISNREDLTKVAELLPTQSGFFFGGTEFDEWYFNEIEYTISMLDEEINEEEQSRENGISNEFYYQSSW